MKSTSGLCAQMRRQGRAPAKGREGCEETGIAGRDATVEGAPGVRSSRSPGKYFRLMAQAVTFLVIGSVAGAQGTAPDTKTVVLRVGPLSATLQDFNREFRRAAVVDTSTLTPDQAGALKFVDRYADELMLYGWALRDTTILLPPERQVPLGMAITTIYQEALRNELLPKYLKIDDALLQGTYERMKTDLRVAAIRVPTNAAMDSVKAELAAGTSFADAARKWSKDPTAGPGGDLGWKQAISFFPETQEVLWRLAVGDVSPAIKEPNFHSIYRILEKRPNTSLLSFAEERSRLFRSAVSPLLGPAGGEMHDDLMGAYHFRVNPENAEWIRAFLQKETAGVRRGYDPDRDKPVSRASEEDRGLPQWGDSPFKEKADDLRPIAFIDGDTLTAVEFIDEVKFIPAMVWPLFDRLSDISDLADEALYDDVQVKEAIRLGLDKRPDVERKVLERKGVHAWRTYRDTILIPALAPTEQELRAVYEEGKSKYNLPERRRFVLVNVSTLDLAGQVQARLRKGMVPSSIVREIGKPELNFRVTPDTTAGWFAFGQNPGIDLALFGMKEGEVSNPIVEQGGYSVFRLEKISPAHQETFEDVRENLRRGLISQREKAAESKLLRRIRPKFEVWVDRAAISTMPIDPAQFQKRGNPMQQ
jgi:parvulin-like peptidyl-prolyl isomerase